MIVVDQANMNSSTGMEFRTTVERLLARLGPGDRAGLAVLPGGIEVDFTRHFALVSGAMGRVTGAGGGLEKRNRMGLAEALAVERDPMLLERIVARECIVSRVDMAAEETLEACRQSLRAEANQLVQETGVRTQSSMMALQRLLKRFRGSPVPRRSCTSRRDWSSTATSASFRGRARRRPRPERSSTRCASSRPAWIRRSDA